MASPYWGSHCSLSDQHFVDHLGNFRRIADCAGQGIHHGGLFQEHHISGNGGFHSQLLYPDRLGANGSAAQRQVAYLGYRDTVAIHIAGNLNDAFIGQVRNTALIHHVHVSPVHTSGFQGFHDIGAVLFSAAGAVVFWGGSWRIFGQSVSNQLRSSRVCLQVAACLPVNPV